MIIRYVLRFGYFLTSTFVLLMWTERLLEGCCITSGHDTMREPKFVLSSARITAVLTQGLMEDQKSVWQISLNRDDIMAD